MKGFPDHRKLLTVLLICGNMIFLLLYVMLCFDNRLAVDDFHLMSNVDQYGIWGGMKFEYDNWNTRFMAMLLTHLVLKTGQVTVWSLFIYGITGIILFIVSVFLLLKNMLKLLEIKVPAFLLLNISIFVIGGIFLSTFRVNETWFWLNTSTMYLWSIILLFLGAAWIIQTGKSTAMTIAGCIAFFYIGASSEPIALMVIFFLLVFLVLVRAGKIVIAVPQKQLLYRSLTALVFCLSAFIILYLGEGLKNRSTAFQSISVIQAAVLNVRITGMIFLYRLPIVLPFLVLFAFPAVFIGQKFYRKQKHFLLHLVLLTAAFLLVVYLHQLPVTYKTQDIAAYRALFPITLYGFVYVSLCWFLLGRNFNINLKIMKAVLPFALLAACMIHVFVLVEQMEMVPKYSAAYDQRMKNILQQKDRDTLLMLPPLPPSGMLYPAEISSDTAHFSNRHLREGLRLKCHVQLKKAEK